MEPLRLKPRQPVEDEVENWDDDDFMIDNDDMSFRTGSSHAQSHRRDSHSSFRSDLESIQDDERHVHVPGDDEKSTLDAIAAATSAGIPIPKNVPSSALMGGTIKRLGGRKIKKIFQEDWGDDLELPAPGQALRVKPQDSSNFPDVLRQVSGPFNPSPVKTTRPQPDLRKENKPTNPSSHINLDRFMDDDDDDVFGDGAATIKAPKLRQPISLITPPTPQKKVEDDDFEADLELPNNGQLKLTTKRDIPKTPSSNADDFDWGEGSLGTRFGGTRRDGFSNRSSSASALSPSIASSITAESEDEALDGLVLPTGPLNLGDRLKKRRISRSPERIPEEKSASPERPIQATPRNVSEKEDLLSGLDIGDGDPFSSGKLKLHRNIQVKETRPSSPARPKTAVSLTFTTKPVPGSGSVSRLPRPLVSHERSHTQPSLEPVSESGGPIFNRSTGRRPQSRLSGHSAHSSISSINTPTTPSSTQSMQPSTPRRRELGTKASLGALRNEPTTTNAQLLRLKRSLPVMRAPQSPARPLSGRFDRPPSRTESGRPQSSLRPKTPTDRRPAYDGSAAQARKPFLPAGASQTQSQHVANKTTRPWRRHDSDHGPELRPLSRAVSRSTMRSPSPRKYRHVEKMASEPVWHQINKPRRQRHFGDGHELDAFDDLPTSAQAESKFVKQPIATGNVGNKSLRNKIYQNVLPDRTMTPSPAPYSPAKSDYQPHFARDTAASRMAREAALAQRAPSNGPLAPLTIQRVAQLSTRTNLNPHPPQSSVRSKKTRKPPQLKPHLISNLTGAKESKVVKGMTYNPVTFRWEGNENALNVFDVPASSPSTASLPPYMVREKESSTPRPMLITNINANKGVKRIGDMVFDPQNMCWLKVDATPTGRSDDPMDGFNAIDDDDDPFKDIPDLEDKDDGAEAGHGGRVSDVKDDWLVGEEFDVGPEFVRRQREEEERWRKKCERWVGTVGRDVDTWRWTIRDIVHST